MFDEAATAELPVILYFRDIDKLVTVGSIPSIPQTWMGDLIHLVQHGRGVFVVATTENPELLANPILTRLEGVYHIPLPVDANDRIRIGRVTRRKYQVR